MNLNELRQREIELRQKGAGILAKCKADGDRAPTDAEQKDLVAAAADLEAVKKQITAAETRANMELTFADNAAQVMSLPTQVLDNPGSIKAVLERFQAGMQVDPMFSGGWRSVAEYANAVKAACAQGGGVIDARLAAPKFYGAPTNYHRETGSDEGYMVPPIMRAEMWELVFAEDSFLNAVDLEPTSSNSVEFIADETTPWGATGIIAYWRAEGTQMQPSKLITKLRQLRLGELYAFVLATEELLQDAPRLNSRLTKKSAQAINWKAGDAIFHGDGTGKPLGILNSGALVTVSKESGQAADTVNLQNILKMYSRILASSLTNAEWMINQDVIPQLQTLTIGNLPVWTPPVGGIQVAPAGFLLGRPIRLSDHASAIGDVGDIIFGDLKGYYAPIRDTGIQFASSMHLYFDYNMQAFRWTIRLAGQPYLSAPVSPARGTTTRSHFVALQAR